MKTRVHAAAAATTALAIIGVIACGTEPTQGSPTSSVKSAVTEPESAPSVSCTEDEALALLRLQHLRALHLAVAMRDRLTDPHLRAFGDRVVEDHINLVHEIDTARGSSTQIDAGTGSSSTRGMETLGEFTDRAVADISKATDADVERVYVHHQLAEHMHALGLIDNIIQPGVTRSARDQELVRHGRDLFARHVRHLYEREATLDGICNAAVR